MNLGTVTGKLATGSVSTTLYQEDKKNKASPGMNNSLKSTLSTSSDRND